MAIINAEDFGFSPESSGINNSAALQKALDCTGEVQVTAPGTYNISNTMFISSNTSIKFSSGVYLRKTPENGEFCHVMLNRGALTKNWDEHIKVDGLQVIVNGVDSRKFLVFGLHGQLAFFYVKDLKVNGFRCMDLGRTQYGVHICTFEDISVTDTIIKGAKDGIHLGCGKRFYISGGTFATGDDAVALNAHDYDVGNPEMGWIENGIVENCHDLAEENEVGYFCRILSGAWVDWFEGMSVQKSDTVVSGGRLYRVQADPDGQFFISKTRPVHESGLEVIDGIKWHMVQDRVTYTAGVRNVTFRDIFIEKKRGAVFSIHFDTGRYSRSYYPNAQIPVQENLSFDNIRILNKKPMPFISTTTPIDTVTVTNSFLYDNPVVFANNSNLPDFGETSISFNGCVFGYKDIDEMLINKIPDKKVELFCHGNILKRK